MVKSILAYSILSLLILIMVALVPLGDATSIAVNNLTRYPHSAARNAAASTANDVTYHQGDVLVGMLNVYLIFWEPTGNVSPRYNQVIESFFNIVGKSPLYHSLSQYHDLAGHAPSGSRLAGSWTDRRPFLHIPVTGANIENEIRYAQQQQGWSGNLHNIFIVFDEKVQEDIPGACAYHGFFGSGGAKTIYARVPHAVNQKCMPPGYRSPNKDDADWTINLASHEMLEAVASPSAAGWYAGIGAEIGDKCTSNFGYITADGSNVNWNGLHFIIQGEWSNLLHNCTLNGKDKITYVVLTNHHSGKVLGVQIESTSDGATVLQWDNTPTPDHQWIMVPVSGSQCFKIVNRNGGGLLSSQSNDIHVLQRNDVGTSNQQWKRSNAGSGYTTFVNCKSNHVLSIQGNSTNDGAPAIEENALGTPSQQWLVTSEP